MIKAATNGGRTRAEHPAIPVTPEQQAAEAAVAADAGAIHVHVRGPDGRESLGSDDVARALGAIRAVCPGTAVGVSTWIATDASRCLSLVKGWKVLPDFASVNVHEDGVIELIRLLLDRRVGVEAAGSPRPRDASRSEVIPLPAPPRPRYTLATSEIRWPGGSGAGGLRKVPGRDALRRLHSGVPPTRCWRHDNRRPRGVE